MITYAFNDGEIWRHSELGWFCTDRDLAGRILATHTATAQVDDWFQRRATELRDQIAEAIRQYDEFHSLEKAA